MNELLELKGITAGYEHTVVLRDVNLSIREHDFIGIIGPNGGGKTTLLKVILGLLKPSLVKLFIMFPNNLCLVICLRTVVLMRDFRLV